MRESDRLREWAATLPQPKNIRGWAGKETFDFESAGHRWTAHPTGPTRSG